MQKPSVSPLRIISGGQTGVDRAALDCAIDLGLKHGGWCPQGRRAEDGSIHPRYQLRETADKDYAVRTRRNVEDSDGTLILYRGSIEGGTELTAQLADLLRKPLFIIDLDHTADAGTLKDWLIKCHIGTLNIAGPRESKQPGIYYQACTLLRRLLV